MVAKLKFYKNEAEAVKVLLPGSVLMLTAGLITLLLTSSSVINGTYAGHVNQLLQAIHMEDIPSFWAAAIIFIMMKIGSITVEFILAKNCLSLYRAKKSKAGKQRTQKISKFKAELPHFKDATITLAILLVILIIPYIILLFVDTDPIKVAAWQGILQSGLGLMGLIIITSDVYSLFEKPKSQTKRTK